jgi:hypothetical protein
MEEQSTRAQESARQAQESARQAQESASRRQQQQAREASSLDSAPRRSRSGPTPPSTPHAT